MISSDIIDLVNELEDLFPVDQWTVEGIHVWPVIRIKLQSYLYTFRVEENKRASTSGKLINVLARHAAAAVTGLIHYVYAYFSDFGNNQRATRPVNALLLSDGVSFARIDGEWYEKFCDPIIARFEHRNMRCVLMSPLREYYVPRHTPSLFVQPAIDWAIFKALISAWLSSPASEHLPRFTECCDYLAARNLGIPLHRVLNVRQDAARIRSVAAYYKKHLARMRPAAAFIVSFYSVDGMAFNLACREFGIPAVDIQHGAEGDLHPAYGRWKKLPPEGYALLPALFWCWSNDEAAAIRRWNSGVRRWHDAVIGGHPWLMLWQQGSAPFIARYDRQMRKVMDAGSSMFHILVTLQYGLGDAGVLAPLLAAIRSAPASWRWWVRLHPAMLHEREKIRGLLRECTDRQPELDVASDLPLYTVLTHMDAHITHSSYTVVEAEGYGIPSIVFSPYGAELFAEQLARGTATAAYSGTEITRAVSALFARRDAAPSHGGQRTTLIDMDRAIDEVLQFGQRGADPIADCPHAKHA